MCNPVATAGPRAAGLDRLVAGAGLCVGDICTQAAGFLDQSYRGKASFARCRMHPLQTTEVVLFRACRENCYDNDSRGYIERRPLVQTVTYRSIRLRWG